MGIRSRNYRAKFEPAVSGEEISEAVRQTAEGKDYEIEPYLPERTKTTVVYQGDNGMETAEVERLEIKLGETERDFFGPLSETSELYLQIPSPASEALSPLEEYSKLPMRGYTIDDWITERLRITEELTMGEREIVEDYLEEMFSKLPIEGGE